MHINRWMKSTSNTYGVYIKSSWTHMTLYANIINAYYIVILYWCNIDYFLQLFPNMNVVMLKGYYIIFFLTKPKPNSDFNERLVFGLFLVLVSHHLA